MNFRRGAVDIFQPTNDSSLKQRDYYYFNTLATGSLHELQLPGHSEATQVNQIELHFPKFSNNLIAASQLFSDPTNNMR